MRFNSLLLIFLLTPFLGWSGELLFQENKGQFNSNVLFKATLNNGALFIEKNKMRFLLHEPQQLQSILEAAHHSDQSAKKNLKTDAKVKFNSHAFDIVFEGASLNSNTLGAEKVAQYYNYYIGNNPVNWANRVAAFKEIVVQNMYENIDFHLFQKGDDIKYEFIVHPGGNPALIKMRYEGTDGLQLLHNDIIIRTSVGEIIDQNLLCFYNEEPDIAINSRYLLENSTVSFNLQQYDSTKTLTIDPVLNFASFSGSSLDNWGYTATYDSKGNAYGAGVAFGGGYPATTGAFQTTYGGGTAGIYPGNDFGMDISISKFSSDGKQLLYATYLGGSKQECPHSLIVNANDELLLLGTTSSSNFPVSSNGFDKTFNGGTTVQVDYVLTFEGTDIVVAKFSEDGANLLGGTYFGGSANDGFNDATETSGLMHNYADFCRGEIIVDQAGSIYIASSTNSSNLPIVNGFQPTFGGGDQDGCIAKFSSDLSSVIWSSYLGGSSSDGVYGLQANSSFELYVTGGTKSSNLNATGGYATSNAGGIDGFVAKISNDGSALMSLSYVGSSAYDQSYFVQIDHNDKIYLYGQTEGNLPISPGVYSNASSGQFIQRYSSDLSVLELSTLVGSGTGKTEIVPSAFLVNYCGQIYLSGWGGSVNATYGGGGTNGLPISPDAHQSSTDGSDFYLMVLEEDLAGLNYATYFGSNTAAEHVDGGTSRFDKNGIVYQSVCAACGNTSAFPTTAGAYAETMNSPNCNMAVFKFDVSKLTAQISPQSDTLACKGDTIHFYNASNGGNAIEWTFHDGTKSSATNPWKIYDSPGRYMVQLVISDPNECPGFDTSFIFVTINDILTPQLNYSDTVLCLGESLTFDFGDANEYLYISANEKPVVVTGPYTISPTKSGELYITNVSNECGRTLTLPITVLDSPQNGTYTSELCEGDTARFAFPIQQDYQYKWSPENGLTVMNDSVYFHPDDSTVFELEITGKCGTAKITYEINRTKIDEGITPDTTVCFGETLDLYASGGNSYNWINVPDEFKNDPTMSFEPNSSQKYTVEIIKNNCKKTKEVNVTVIGARPKPNAYQQTICEGKPATFPFPVQKDFKYSWSPTDPSLIYEDEVTFTPNQNTSYTLTITGDCGTAEILYDVAVTQIHDSVIDYFMACRGDSLTLYAEGGESYRWEPADALTNTTDSAPSLLIKENQIFTVEIGKGNCVKEREVTLETFPKKPQPSEKEYTIQFGQKQDIILLDEYSYVWTPIDFLNCNRCPNPVSEPNRDITYYYTYTDENNCSITDSVKINVIFDLYIPNSFTPDNDGLNDVFYAYSHLIKEFEIDIFNRWGEKIFYSNDIHKGWDGTINGKDAQVDVYVWKVRYVKVHTSRVRQMVGTVTLVR